MTASLLKRFCRTSRTLPIRSDQSTREVWWQKTIRSQECGDPALRRGGSIYWPRPAISSSNADSIRPGWPKSPVHPAKEAIIAAICEADLAEWLEEETLETAVAVGDREGILAWIERIAIDEPSHENRRMMCEFVATVGCNPIIAEINRKADVRLRTSLGAALASLAPGASPQDRSTVVDFIITMSWGMVAGAELFPYRDHKILRHYMASLFRRELAAMCN
ncbi:hypothetical protein [Sphingomonas oryzagri]